jgi:hypothetical protein
MVTKEQAVNARHGDEFHFTGKHDCKVRITRVRVTGKCQVWKTSPERFRLPVKYGLYESSCIDDSNAGSYHAAKDCTRTVKVA